ncbi:MAG: SurA N-terminal domain-containing protein [Bacteroidia bacterium]
MATIGKIRQRSGALIFIIAAALLLFLLSDVLSNNQSLLGPSIETSVGTIDGREVDARYFEQLYDRYLSNAKNQRNTKELSTAERTQVNNQTWQYIVEDQLLTQEYESLGMSITEKEMNDAAYGVTPHQYFTQIPAFQNEAKQFDPAKLREFVNNFDQVPLESQIAWNDLLEDVKNDKIRTKYFSLISKALYMTDLEAKDEYLGQNKQSSIKFVRLKTADLDDENFEVSEEEVRKYAQENDKVYENNERSIQYVSFTVDASKEDTTATQNEVNTLAKEFETEERAGSFARLNSDGETGGDQFYSIADLSKSGIVAQDVAEQIFTDSIGTVYGPTYEFGTYKIVKVFEEEAQAEIEVDERDAEGNVIGKKSELNFNTNFRAAHILIKPEGDTDADTATAMAEARKILNRAKSGEDFAELAKEFGTDGTKDKGGDLGWWQDGGMVKAFQNGVNSMSKGDLKVVKSRFGAHVISLTHDPVNVRRKIAVIEKQIIPSEQTEKNVYAKAAEFWDKAQTAEEFINTTRELNLNIGVAENIKQDDNTITGFTDGKRLVSWAFKQEAVDAITKDIMTIDNSYVIAMLTEIKVEGDLNIVDNQADIEASVIREKKLDELETKMNGAYTADLDAIASALGVEVETASNVNFNTPLIANLGSELKVIGAVSGLKDGAVSNVIRGSEGIYVVMLEGASEVELPESFAEYKGNQISSKATSSRFDVLPALKKTIEIADRRYNFY